jgi:hypothetical protein
MLHLDPLDSQRGYIEIEMSAIISTPKCYTMFKKACIYMAKDYNVECLPKEHDTKVAKRRFKVFLY